MINRIFPKTILDERMRIMNKKDDLRIRKTKLSIKNALYALLKEKPFEEISVIDITKKAMINRSTFYLHYKDKESLIQSLSEEMFEEIEVYSSLITKENLDRSKKYHTPFPHIVPILTYIKENPDFFKLIILSSYKHTFYLNLANRLSEKAIPLFSEIKPDKLVLNYGPSILINVISCILTKWIKNDMKESPEEIAKLITKIVLAVITVDYK